MTNAPQLTEFDYTARTNDPNLERRKRDENAATERILRSKQKFNCEIIPEFKEDGTVDIRVGCYGEDSDETQEKIRLFQEDMNKVLAHYKVAFRAIVIEENGKPEPKIFLLTTW